MALKFINDSDMNIRIANTTCAGGVSAASVRHVLEIQSKENTFYWAAAVAAYCTENNKAHG